MRRVFKNDLPDSCHSDFGTLRVSQEGLEDLEEALLMLLEPLDDSFQDSIENVDADFAVHSLGSRRSLEKEGEESRPTVDWHLDARDSSNNTGRGVSNESTG
jgi:hypothetical protein